MSASPATTTPIGFAAEIRAATTTTHAEAEGAGLLGQLVEGHLDVPAYAVLVAQLHHVYATLERVGAGLATDPVAGVFVDTALDRRDALARDLAWLRERGAAAEHPILPATRAYGERLELVRAWPAGFVAHHYTRYLGDLSGGQYIGRAAQRHLGGGVDFYRFAAILDPRGYKIAYRAKLDAIALVLDAEERARLVTEVIAAYACNTALLDEAAQVLAGREVTG